MTEKIEVLKPKKEGEAEYQAYRKMVRESELIEILRCLKSHGYCDKICKYCVYYTFCTIIYCELNVEEEK
jgi:hypothetical protein